MRWPGYKPPKAPTFTSTMCVRVSWGEVVIAPRPDRSNGRTSARPRAGLFLADVPDPSKVGAAVAALSASQPGLHPDELVATIPGDSPAAAAALDVPDLVSLDHGPGGYGVTERLQQGRGPRAGWATRPNAAGGAPRGGLPPVAEPRVPLGTPYPATGRYTRPVAGGSDSRGSAQARPGRRGSAPP